MIIGFDNGCTTNLLYWCPLKMGIVFDVEVMKTYHIRGFSAIP